MTNTAMTREEALLVVEEYYRYLRKHRMDRLFWDGINQAVIVLGGEGDPKLDHEEYVRMYERDGITLRQVIEEEIRWAGNIPGEDHRIFPEPDKSLSTALTMALTEMERRGLCE